LATVSSNGEVRGGNGAPLTLAPARPGEPLRLRITALTGETPLTPLNGHLLSARANDDPRSREVLTFLSTTRKSGTFTFVNGAREACLFFDDGALVYASSNQEQFRLGAILLRKKKIRPDQRDRIDALMQRDGGQFGQLCVQSGVMTDAELRDSLKIQVSEIVYDAFVWDGGTFSFVQETSLPSHAVTISIDLASRARNCWP
jgi:hypothetical protein